ncbi:MAG: hypothetical protein DRR19_11855 [Candidatus Parabeggiatoa sp. nov. 1]|nr:MAG: hypothetical protein DRR19_11855 [Gammaproteobacteria bacterium]
MEAIHCHFAQGPDLPSILNDGTIVRAHSCAAGTPQGILEEPQEQALGRFQDGITFVIPVMVDALGNPLDFILTGGQVANVTQANTLKEGIKVTYALMEKASDADKLIEQLKL